MYIRLFAAVAVLAMLISGMYLFAGLPSTRAALLSQIATQETSRNERKLVKSNWRGEPVRVNRVKVKRGEAQFGTAFQDADDDWLAGFSLNVTNTTNKDIVFIELAFTFFEKEEKLVRGRTPVTYPVFYGSPEGIFDGSTAAHPVRPKESVDVTFTAEEHDKLKEILLNNNYPTTFRHVDVRIDRVVFADGLVWYKCYYFRRDPTDPNRFIRDKPSGKGEERALIKPGTSVRQKQANPSTVDFEKVSCQSEPKRRGVFFRLLLSKQARC